MVDVMRPKMDPISNDDEKEVQNLSTNCEIPKRRVRKYIHEFALRAGPEFQHDTIEDYIKNQTKETKET